MNNLKLKIWHEIDQVVKEYNNGVKYDLLLNDVGYWFSGEMKRRIEPLLENNNKTCDPPIKKDNSDIKPTKEMEYFAEKLVEWAEQNEKILDTGKVEYAIKG